MEHDLSYPIGKFEPQLYTAQQKLDWIAAVKFLPEQLEMALQGLDENQLHTPYRPSGWTIHQLVHHIADSHLNGYIRIKLALTEDAPIIKPYDQDAWVTTADIALPYNVATTLVHAIHKKWVLLFEKMTATDFERIYNHPENGAVTLWHMLGLYAWHGLHHVTQINDCRTRNNWK
jgi:uncharacterized damage-inducible protein DinB